METNRTTFSISTLMLLTAVLVLGVSHFNLSKRNSRLLSELAQLRSQLGLLHVIDDKKVHATALPTYGPRQWRWRVQISADGKYAVHYAVGSSIPLRGFPATSKVATPFSDKQNKPLSNGEPVVLSFAITQRDDGQWAVVVGTSSGHPTTYYLRDAPAWLNEKSFSGWSVNVHGKDGTIAPVNQEPLLLLSYRKGKQIPPSPRAPRGGTVSQMNWPSSAGWNVVVSLLVPGAMVWFYVLERRAKSRHSANSQQRSADAT